jgi:hypothetical protein
MIYSIFCTLNGKTIAAIGGECADDDAAIAKARGYLRSSTADTARVHRDAPLYPLGEMIAELKADPEQESELPPRRFQAYFYSEADWARTTIEAETPELALQRARQIESEETETLDFKSYDGGAGVEHIEIRSAEGDTVAEWRHEDLLLRTAARELRDVLEEQTDAAQGVIDSWASGDLAAAVLGRALSARPLLSQSTNTNRGTTMTASTLTTAKAADLNSVLHGDCVEIMRGMQPGSVDFVLTDPPYITRYADRSGRTVANDDNHRWLKPAFAQMHRLLKAAAFCVSFYGWNKADLFIEAWRSAGFRIGGHLVFRKRYPSSTRFLRY